MAAPPRDDVSMAVTWHHEAGGTVRDPAEYDVLGRAYTAPRIVRRRRAQAIALSGQGAGTSQIAAVLGVSPRTVRRYLRESPSRSPVEEAPS